MKFRKYRLKKKKTIIKSRIFWPALLALTAMSGLFYLIVLAPFFQIKDIFVSGQERILTEEIKDPAWQMINRKVLFFNSKSIFLARTKTLKTMLLKSVPTIKEIKIERLWPNLLSIEIKERQMVGSWKNNDSYDSFRFDETGIAFAFDSFLMPNDLRIVSKQSSQAADETALGKKVIEEKTLNQIRNIKKTVAEKTGILMYDFVLFEQEGRLNAETLKESWSAYFDLNGDLNWQILELELVLEKSLPLEKRKGLEYIDLRFSKVAYKYK